MNSNYAAETNPISKSVPDANIERRFLGYIDKITDKLVHGWACNLEAFNEALWVDKAVPAVMRYSNNNKQTNFLDVED